MARKLSDNQIHEITFKSDWCFTILTFMAEKFGNSTSISQFSDLIKDAKDKQNLRGLRYLFKDINEWARSLDDIVEELNLVLKNKFGQDLTSHSEKDRRKVNAILRAGRIKNDDEYRLLMERVDNIYADDSKKKELESINKLLAQFDLMK